MHLGTEMLVGQHLDIALAAEAVPDADLARWIAVGKSGRYTIQRPLSLGAALAGRDDLQQAFEVYGLAAGEAFQLRDDLLGVFGDPEETGKPAGDDLVEGKRTVLVALALDAAPRAAAVRLDAALGTPLSPADVDELRGIIEDSGARAQVEEVIGALADRAVAALQAADIDDDARGVLTDLAAAATQRSV
jgi:geranylgeranyl diphosphate synthase type I